MTRKASPSAMFALKATSALRQTRLLRNARLATTLTLKVSQNARFAQMESTKIKRARLNAKLAMLVATVNMEKTRNAQSAPSPPKVQPLAKTALRTPIPQRKARPSARHAPRATPVTILSQSPSHAQQVPTTNSKEKESARLAKADFTIQRKVNRHASSALKATNAQQRIKSQRPAQLEPTQRKVRLNVNNVEKVLIRQKKEMVLVKLAPLATSALLQTKPLRHAMLELSRRLVKLNALNAPKGSTRAMTALPSASFVQRATSVKIPPRIPLLARQALSKMLREKENAKHASKAPSLLEKELNNAPPAPLAASASPLMLSQSNANKVTTKMRQGRQNANHARLDLTQIMKEQSLALLAQLGLSARVKESANQLNAQVDTSAPRQGKLVLLLALSAQKVRSAPLLRMAPLTVLRVLSMIRNRKQNAKNVLLDTSAPRLEALVAKPVLKALNALILLNLPRNAQWEPSRLKKLRLGAMDAKMDSSKLSKARTTATTALRATCAITREPTPKLATLAITKMQLSRWDANSAQQVSSNQMKGKIIATSVKLDTIALLALSIALLAAQEPIPMVLEKLSALIAPLDNTSLNLARPDARPALPVSSAQTPACAQFLAVLVLRTHSRARQPARLALLAQFPR